MSFSYMGKMDSCCICFNIKKGCELIGFLTSFVCFLQIAVHIWMLFIVENVPLCYYQTMKEDKTDGTHMKHCLENSLWFVRATLIFESMIFLLGFVGAVMLMKGISKKKPNLFYVWFVFCFLKIGLNLMSFGSFQNPKESVLNMVFVGILIYFFVVVKVYQHELRVANEGIIAVVALTRPEATNLHAVITSVPDRVSDAPKDYPPPSYTTICPPPPSYSTLDPSLMVVNESAPHEINVSEYSNPPTVSINQISQTNEEPTLEAADYISRQISGSNIRNLDEERSSVENHSNRQEIGLSKDITSDNVHTEYISQHPQGIQVNIKASAEAVSDTVASKSE